MNENKTADIAEQNNGDCEIAGVKYMNTENAARYLHISVTSLHSLKDNGKITFLKHGGSIYYQKEWLDEYISESTKTGGAKK
jgi:hypothetical protein